MTKGIKAMWITTIAVSVLVCVVFQIGAIVSVANKEVIRGIVLVLSFDFSLACTISLIADYLKARECMGGWIKADLCALYNQKSKLH